MPDIKQTKPLKTMLSVCTFYHYHPLPKSNLNKLKESLLHSDLAQHIRGLILLSPEGCNATLIGPSSLLKNYIHFIQSQTHIPIQARWQSSRLWGFKKLRIKIKNEIVQTGQSGLPIPPENSRLSAVEWKKAMNSPSTTLLDIRNDYEVQIGRFKNAQHLHLKNLKIFPNS